VEAALSDNRSGILTERAGSLLSLRFRLSKFGSVTMKAAFRSIGVVIGTCLLVGSTFGLSAAAATLRQSSVRASVDAKVKLNSTLLSLRPSGSTNCTNQPKANFPTGVVAVSASVFCDLPKLGAKSYFYSYVFNSASAYTAGLAAFNSYEAIYPSVAGNECPTTGVRDYGVLPWRSSNLPPARGQVLECVMVEGTASQNNDPLYVWTVPSKKTLLYALADPASTMAHLNSWWKKNAENSAHSISAHSKSPAHLSTLTSVAPSGLSDCSVQPPSNYVSGMTGVVASDFCSVPTLGTSSSFYSYVFDNATDYATSLAAYNSFKDIDGAGSGSGCPLGSGAVTGVVQWHSSTFPTRNGQNLECRMSASVKGGPGVIPDYIWTVPSKNVLMEVVGDPNSTMQSLDTWWTGHT
jgi:hypothetical protein